MNPGAERRQFLVSIFSKRGSGEKKTYPEIDDGEFFSFEVRLNVYSYPAKNSFRQKSPEFLHQTILSVKFLFERGNEAELEKKGEENRSKCGRC